MKPFKIELSCSTCVKCKDTSFGSGNGSNMCKHRDFSFDPLFYNDNWPCENWTPKKSDVKIWILREKAEQYIKNQVNKIKR